MRSDNSSKLRATSSNSMRQQQQSYGKLPAFDSFTLALNKTLQRIKEDSTCSLGHEEFKQLLISSGSQERLKLILQALQLNNENAIHSTKQKKEILNCLVTVAQTFKTNLQSEWRQLIELLESKLKDQDMNTYAALLNAVQAVASNSFGKQKYASYSSGIEESKNSGNNYQQTQQQQKYQQQSSLVSGKDDANDRYDIVNNGKAHIRSQTQPLEDLDENLDEDDENSNSNMNINGISLKPVHFTSLRQIYEQVKQTQQTQQQQNFAEEQQQPYVKLLNQDDSNSSSNKSANKTGIILSARSQSLKNLRDFLNLWFAYMEKMTTSNLPIDLRRGVCAASCLSIALQSVDPILISSIRQEVCDQLVKIIEKSSQTQQRTNNSGCCCNDTQVFDCLMSLALSQEELFQDCASSTIKLTMEHLRNSISNNNALNTSNSGSSSNNDWQKQKVLIDLLYTLSVFTPEQLFPYFQEAERALNDLKTHRMQDVRNAAVVALQSLREIRENNNNGGNSSALPQRDVGENQGKSQQQEKGANTVNSLDIVPRRENQQENHNLTEVSAVSQQKLDQSPQQRQQQPSGLEVKPSSAVQNKMQLRNIELTRAAMSRSSYQDMNKHKANNNNMDAFGEKRNEALPGLRRLSPNLSRAIHQVDESWRENEKRKAIKRGASPEFVNHGVKADVEIYLPKKAYSPLPQSQHNMKVIQRDNDLSLIDNQILQISAQLANCQQLLKQRVNNLSNSNTQVNPKRNSNSFLIPSKSQSNFNGKGSLESKSNFQHSSKENKNPMNMMMMTAERNTKMQYFQNQVRNSNQQIKENQGQQQQQFSDYQETQKKQDEELIDNISNKKQPEDDYYQLNQNNIYDQRHPFQEWQPQQKKQQQQQSPKLEKLQQASPKKEETKDKLGQKISNRQQQSQQLQQQQPQEDKIQPHNRIFQSSQSQVVIPVESKELSPSNHNMSSSVGAMNRPLASIRNQGGKQEDQQLQQLQGQPQQRDPQQIEKNSPIQPQILQLLQSPIQAKNTNQSALTVSQRPFSISPERSQILQGSMMNGQSPGDQERITRRQRQRIFEKSPKRQMSNEDTQKYLPVSSTSPSLRTKDRSMSELRRENQQLRNENQQLKKQQQEGVIISQKLLEKNEELRNQLLVEQQSKEVMRVFIEDTKDRQYSSQLSQVNAAIASLVKQVAQERLAKEAVIKAMEEGKQEAQLFEGQLQETIDSLKSQIEIVRQKLQENYLLGQGEKEEEEEEGKVDNKKDDNNEELRYQQNNNVQSYYWNNNDHHEGGEDGQQQDKNEFDYDYSHNASLTIPIVANREQQNSKQAARQNQSQQQQQYQQHQFFSFKNAANSNSNHHYHLGSISHNDSIQNRNINQNIPNYLHEDANHDGMINNIISNNRNTANFNNNQPIELVSRSSSSSRVNNFTQPVKTLSSPLGLAQQQEQLRQSREGSKHERVEQTLSDLYSEQKREKGRFNNVQQQQQQVILTNSRYPPNDRMNKANEGIINKDNTTHLEDDHFDKEDKDIFGEQHNNNNHGESVNVFFYETEDSQQRYLKQQQGQNNYSIQSSPKEKEEMDPIFSPPLVSKQQQYKQQQQQPLNLQVLQMKYNQQQQQKQQQRMQQMQPNKVEDKATSDAEQKKTTMTNDNLSLILTLLRSQQYNQAMSLALTDDNPSVLINALNAINTAQKPEFISQLDSTRVEYLLTKLKGILYNRNSMDIILPWIEAIITNRQDISRLLLNSLRETLQIIIDQAKSPYLPAHNLPSGLVQQIVALHNQLKSIT